MSTESAHLPTFGAETETETENKIRPISTRLADAGEQRKLSQSLSSFHTPPAATRRTDRARLWDNGQRGGVSR